QSEECHERYTGEAYDPVKRRPDRHKNDRRWGNGYVDGRFPIDRQRARYERDHGPRRTGGHSRVQRELHNYRDVSIRDSAEKTSRAPLATERGRPRPRRPAPSPG